MAGIKISDLPAVVTPALSDVFPIDQGAVTYKESAQQLLTLFQANGAALTRTNDTNVTLTLGGSPTNALLNATSLTLGWSGSLAVGRGGTGNTTFTAYAVICAGTTATGAFQNVSGVGSANQVLVSNGAGALPTWQSVPGLTPAALTKTDDTNVTLTLGGTPATALLQATSLTLGWTGTLSPTRGGTGVNNGSSTFTIGGNFAMSGAFTFTGTLTNTTAVTFPTSGTLATTSQLPTPSALTKVDDTNVTLTLGGSPSTALLAATSITAGWTGQLGPTRGGTGIGTYALGDTLYGSGVNTLSKLSGNITSGIQYLSQTGTGVVSAAPVWSTISGGDITGAALTKVDDTNVTLTLGGTPSTALLRSASITAGWTGQLGLTRGGTNASLTASTGGIVYSGASALAILSGTATAGQLLQSGASAAPTWTTSTYPATNAINTLLYASSANVMSALATTNRAVLGTSSSGAPNWLALTDGQIVIGSTAGAPAAASISAGTGISVTPGSNSITIATTGAVVTPSALTKTDDTNVTLTLGGSPSTALVNAASLTLGWTGTLGLTRGGTAASLTASNGGIVYSNASTLAILAGTATAGQLLTSGASTTPAWTTTTYPLTNAINTLLYASSANVMSALATANSATLTTNASGVPSWTTSTSVGTMVQLSVLTATNSSNIAFTGLDTTKYTEFYIDFQGVYSSTDNVTFTIVNGTGAGPTYNTANYIYSGWSTNTSSVSVAPFNSTGASSVTLFGQTGNTSQDVLCGYVRVATGKVSGMAQNIYAECYGFDNTEVFNRVTIAAKRDDGTAITALKFAMSSGNITAGTFTLYGIV